MSETELEYAVTEQIRTHGRDLEMAQAVRSSRLIARYVVLALAVGAPSVLRAQVDTGLVTISGTVVDQVRQPIEGAEVLVIGGQVKATTNAKGWFQFQTAVQPQILIQVRRIGFNAQLLRLDGPWSGTILLTPGVYRLAELSVTAAMAKPGRYSGTSKYDEVFRRRLLGLGELIDRKQIDDRGAVETAQLLQGHVGVKVQIRHSEVVGDVEGAIVTFNRCSEFPPKINVYLDGRKLIPRFVRSVDDESALTALSRGEKPTSEQDAESRRLLRVLVGEMLARVNPSDIEMIEIFRGPGQLPVEFNDGNCGAIAIWTREGGR